MNHIHLAFISTSRKHRKGCFIPDRVAVMATKSRANVQPKTAMADE
jgi:hypothetical protein